MGLLSQFAQGISAAAYAGADLLAKRDIEQERSRLEIEKLMRAEEIQKAREERARQAERERSIFESEQKLKFGEASARQAEALKGEFFEGELSRAEKLKRAENAIALEQMGDPRRIAAVQAEARAKALGAETPLDQAARRAQIAASGSALQDAALRREEAKMRLDREKTVYDLTKTVTNENEAAEKRLSAAKQLRMLQGGKADDLSKRDEVMAKGLFDTAKELFKLGGEENVAKAERLNNQAYAILSGQAQGYQAKDKDTGAVIGTFATPEEAAKASEEYAAKKSASSKSGGVLQSLNTRLRAAPAFAAPSSDEIKPIRVGRAGAISGYEYNGITYNTLQEAEAARSRHKPGAMPYGD